MSHSLWDQLPGDLQDLILDHRRAMVIQSNWRRYHHYSHAKACAWHILKLMLGDDLYRKLIPYPRVRHEWKTEPESWMYSLMHDRRNLEVISNEVELGLWGRPTPAFCK